MAARLLHILESAYLGPLTLRGARWYSSDGSLLVTLDVERVWHSGFLRLRGDTLRLTLAGHFRLADHDRSTHEH